MSEKEKAIIENIAKAIPNMTEENKAYFLGLGEGIALGASQRKEEEKKED